tara:strand:- start:198 stop:464 length:267 start_codon:yes stop_codon:yes gene_type:complete
MKFTIYLIVFGILVGSTLLELFLVGQAISTTVLIILIIGWAGIKAILIAVFFQHLINEPKSLSTLLLLPLIGAVILLVLSLVSVTGLA